MNSNPFGNRYCAYQAGGKTHLWEQGSLDWKMKNFKKTASFFYTLALLLLIIAQVTPIWASPLVTPSELTFLRGVAKQTLKSCVVESGAFSSDKKNTLGFRAITPGGYPAIWVQDFAIIYSSGLIPREDGVRHLQLILEKQNGAVAKDLGNQVMVPPYAIADHINVDGNAVFFPGTYDPTDNKNGDFGYRPPSNNQFDVIWLAQMLTESSSAKEFLNQKIMGFSIYERLKLAFDVPEIDSHTQLVHTTKERRAVGFIFYDTVYMTGDLLMASLIRYRAAKQLASLAEQIGEYQDARHFSEIVEKISNNIVRVFGDHDGTRGGWLRASTGVSSQPDVWGSIYAVYIGAVVGKNRIHLLKTINAALAMKGEIEFEGAIRHVPLSFDA
ncbi:MAG: hypothetical protein QM496_22305, partial [Verrucomicrobiota bacterium]